MGERQGHRIALYTQNKKPDAGLKNQKEGKVWASILQDVERDKNVWRLIALSSIVLFAISILGWYKTINIPRTIPLVIEVNEMGEPKYIGEIDQLSYETFVIKDYIKENHIKTFIRNTREVYLDVDVMKETYNNAFYMITENLRGQLSNEINERQPFKMIGKSKVKVKVDKPIRIVNNSWQCEWVDEYYSLSGNMYQKRKYRGIFTLAQQEPIEEEKTKNPLGLWITDYNIVEITEKGTDQ